MYDDNKNQQIITIACIVTVNPGKQSKTVNSNQPGALSRAIAK